ncbi:MAG TPA: EpsI family protein [Pyrinomonadaceae bacterium]|nr:EpsI family protein [Pyrinomonadaceae bacterium]
MKSSLRFGVVLILILVIGILVNAWSYLGEAHVERKALKDFPQSIGAWQQTGADKTIDDETMKVLRASDYLQRDFRNPDGQVANLYVGYYATQRNGATYHSPLNCLPGSGWTLSEPGKATIALPDGTSFVANKYVIQTGSYRSMMIYWYQGRGRNVASEYWGKIYTVFDSVRLRRSDGALVRVTVPIGNSEAKAERTAIEFASVASAALPQFVP